MDAAKNITTTEIKCGTALGSSNENQWSHATQVTARWRPLDRTRSQSLTSSKSILLLGVVGTSAFSLGLRRWLRSSAKTRRIPTATEGAIQPTPDEPNTTMYTTVRSSPKNI